MSFFKKAGNLVGTVAGGVIGGAVTLVGEVTNSNYVKEIGEGIFNASVSAGNIMGQAAEGAAGIVGGIIASDKILTNKGVGELGDAVGKTIKGTVAGISNIASNGCQAIGGIMDGDKEKTINASKNLLKTAAIAALAIGVADYVGIIGDDGIDTNIADVEVHDTSDIDHVEVSTHHVAELNESDGTNFVDPHYVEGYYRSDGTYVNGYWRDGDENSNTTLTTEDGGGYLRSNPKKV